MLTLPQTLLRNIRHLGAATAIVDGEAKLTWRAFGARVERAAGVLAALGIGRGDRFAIHALNGPIFEELRWAGFRQGAIPVMVNWRLAAPEIAHIIEDAACRAVFVDGRFAAVHEASELAGLAVRRIALSEAETCPSLPAYDDLFAAAQVPDPAEAEADDDAILYYTGGTTGRAKGVRLSHANIVSNGLAFGLAQGARADDVFLHTAPMFHSADLLATGWFLAGAAHAYLPAFSPAGFLDTLAATRATVTVTVPTMLIMLLGDPAFAEANVSSLRTMIFGASPMDPEWIRRVAAAFPGAELSNSYGLTETAPDLTVFEPLDFRRAIEAGAPEIASVGKPNALVELRVVDGDGAEAPPGEAGELWARGPNITKGYLNLEELSREVLADGWLRTGDVARIDEGGYVYLLDRTKDMVISGGENVYSAEVEAALYRHEDVHECAVIGVPDERLGEALFAVIVARPGAVPDEHAIIEHCRRHIAGYKIPRRMAFVDAMPKSAMGKILKADLRAEYGAR